MPVVSGSDPSTLYGAELVTTPYVSVAEFKVEPSFLQLDNLVSGSVSSAANDAELYNKLLQASQWATDTANMPLHGHYAVENDTMRVKRNGLLVWHPAHNPVQIVTGLQYAYQPSSQANMTAVTDLTQQWIEGQALVKFPFAPMSGAWNALQLGPPASADLYVQWTYAAGFPCTTLGANTNIGDMVLTVTDPAAIIPGMRLRLWTPGSEEACTVAQTYGVGSTTVPLNSALTKAHTAGDNISAMPATLKLAVVNYTCALLSHPDTSAEDQFPDARAQLTTRSEDARKAGTGLVAEAYRLLRSYMRVR